MPSKNPAVQHGFFVRLVTNDPRRLPAGRYWFNAARPRKRPRNLERFLRHVGADPAVRVVSVTPATQPKKEATS